MPAVPEPLGCFLSARATTAVAVRPHIGVSSVERVSGNAVGLGAMSQRGGAFGSALSSCVGHVLSVGAKPEMGRVNTRGIVTRVADAEAVRNMALMELV